MENQQRLRNIRRSKRSRYIDLARIASEVCELLETKGVSADEGCTVRRIAEDMWNSGRHLGLDNALREDTTACDVGLDQAPMEQPVDVGRV
jgi:hypothetical protein